MKREVINRHQTPAHTLHRYAHMIKHPNATEWLNDIANSNVGQTMEITIEKYPNYYGLTVWGGYDMYDRRFSMHFELKPNSITGE